MCIGANEIKFFLYIFIFLLFSNALGKNLLERIDPKCASGFNKEGNIGYYCLNKALSFAHQETIANNICLENKKNGVDPLTIRRVDEERIQFSCKNLEELNAINSNDSSGNLKKDMNQAKQKCKDLGFKEKTEKFGSCVLELTK